MTPCVSGKCSNQLSYISILWTERDSNPRRLDLQSNALPTELPVHFYLWEQKDSNLPSMQITEFTVRRLTNSSITPILSLLLDSNQRHLVCKTSALPTELRWEITGYRLTCGAASITHLRCRTIKEDINDFFVTPSRLELETPALKVRCSKPIEL